MVGPKSSGKSSLVTACMLASAEARRTSDVVDFTWVQRANALGKHDSACIWEFPGTDALACALVTKQVRTLCGAQHACLLACQARLIK